MKIGEKVGEYIKAQGTSIAELAKPAALETELVSDIISGKTEFELEYYVLICNALDIDYGFFPEWEKGDFGMFKNLYYEQTKHGFTDRMISGFIGITPTEYRMKKKTGDFLVSDCRRLCLLFGASFDYLFETDNDK